MYDDDDYVDFDEYKNMQAAINTGYCWSMEGSVGRAMMGAIEAGYCMLGKERARDYYGNTIPSRKDVKHGQVLGRPSEPHEGNHTQAVLILNGVVDTPIHCDMM